MIVGKIAALTLLILIPGLAWCEYFVIKDYSVIIDVKTDGSLRVTENILVDFKKPRYMFYRFIPAHSSSKYHPAGIKISHLHSQEAMLVRVQPHTIAIRFGLSNELIPAGEKHFSFSYRVDNVIKTGNQKYDELVLNIIGTEWNVPIYKSSVRIDFPGGSTAWPESLAYAVFTGSEDEPRVYSEKAVSLSPSRPILKQEPGLTHKLEANSIHIENSQELSKNEGLTVQLRIKKGRIKKTVVSSLIRGLGF